MFIVSSLLQKWQLNDPSRWPISLAYNYEKKICVISTSYKISEFDWFYVFLKILPFHPQKDTDGPFVSQKMWSRWDNAEKTIFLSLFFNVLFLPQHSNFRWYCSFTTCVPPDHCGGVVVPVLECLIPPQRGFSSTHLPSTVQFYMCNNTHLLNYTICFHTNNRIFSHQYNKMFSHFMFSH